MFTDKDLINLPNLVIGIPVQHNATACLTHMLRNGIGDIKISLEDLRVEGATLILASHIQLAPNEYLEEEDEMIHLRDFWDGYMEEQKAKLGLNKPLTREEIQRELQLMDEGIITYADPLYWSEEKKAYCKEIEDAIFADSYIDVSIFDDKDDWEEEEYD